MRYFKHTQKPTHIFIYSLHGGPYRVRPRRAHKAADKRAAARRLGRRQHGHSVLPLRQEDLGHARRVEGVTQLARHRSGHLVVAAAVDQ